ncbi:MAG: diacylglycerol kinase [Parcubacteria group bacterium Gr01-1014_106]|nr:MAG: diacylglycerol kinase [Parcubacteria group bacterium Gr01-1014_106]
MMRRISHAMRGVRFALQSREIVGHMVIALVVVFLGVLACLDATRWTLLVFAIGLVLVAETLNTALEQALNVSGIHHPVIGRSKDLAAAAVLFAALTAGAIGVFIFAPVGMSGTLAHCLS